MKSQARFVITLVAILTAFSLFTILRNRPVSNFQAEPNEITTPYNESEEENFLEPSYHDMLAHAGKPEQSHRASAEDVGASDPTNEGRSQELKLQDFLNSQEEIEKFDFRSCKMSDCFDYSRCKSSQMLRVNIIPRSKQGNGTLNISGESNIIYQNILNIVRGSKYYESDPEKACIFLLEDDTLDRDPLSSSFRSTVIDIFQRKHRLGLNHLVFNFYSGSWPDYREDDFASMKLGAAILSKASNSQEHHRRGFDISIPLFSYQHPVFDNQTNNTNKISFTLQKPYFLTFKGKRYILGSGSDTRNSLYHLNNGRDVLMLTTCRHGKKWREIKSERCDQDEESYSRYDFVELLKNSTFCLTPRGRQLGSFQFLETLNYGCIPVVLSDGWVWPFDEIIDWSDAAIQFPEDQILLVPDMLRDIDDETILRMRIKCHTLYNQYFSSVQKIVLTTLSIIERRLNNKLILP